MPRGICTPIPSGLDSPIGPSSFSFACALVGSPLEFLGWTPVNVKLLLPPRQSRGISPLFREHAASISISHSRFPLRQRQRVYQQNRRPTAGETARRTDQEPTSAERRQRPCRDQKRRGDSQTYRLWIH